MIEGWAAVFREGWVDVVPDLTKIQGGAEKARYQDLATKLAHHPDGGGLAIRHARLFDPVTATLQPDMTVVIAGDHIQAVGKDSEVTVPPGIEVIDAKGKELLPGLWDMHVHLSEEQGLFDIASGVTTVRDLANDVDQLLDMRRRWASGEAIGPRVLMAGFHGRPRPLRRPHQGPGSRRRRRRSTGWTATPSSATCRSRCTARSIRPWCRRSSSAAHALGSCGVLRPHPPTA